MAEARLAVAFRLQVNDDGNLEMNLDRRLVYHVLLSVVRSARFRVVHFRNVLVRTIYPGSLWTLLALLISVFVVHNLDPEQAVLSTWKAYIPLLGYLPLAAQGAVANLLLGVTVWTVCVLLQKYALLLTLSYKGFLYVPHGKTPLHIRMWFLLARFLEGPMKPTTYTYQTTLPYLPLPSVGDTCSRYLKSIRHLVSDERHAELQRMSEDYQNTLGPRVQRYLWLWWLCSKNYVSEWWVKYVYLRGRSPIMVNSNYYILDNAVKFTDVQVARAAVIVNIVAQFKENLDKECIDPIMIQNTIPLCMEQYERLFGTTRVPGIEQDAIVHVAPSQSQHFVVLRHGRYYEIPLKWNGRLMTPAEIEERLQCIMDEDTLDKDIPESHLHLAAMTGVNRTKWAEFREKHILGNRTNEHSLERIDSAAFMVVLDDGRPDIGDDEETTRFGRLGLHGNGHSRWFDKSLVMSVFENGRFQVTAEHAWADAPVVAHITEYIFTTEHELHQKGCDYSADGHALGRKRAPSRPPQRLSWEFTAPAADIVAVALQEARTLLNDLDLYIMQHEQFGKGAIKQCKLSPDAFVQMALQLAYFRDIGHFSLTYEASMTRLYRNGRTETVRPGTVESTAFVRAMEDPSAPREEKQRLLHRAAAVHQDNYRNCMAGRGFDRHLFTMYVICQYLKVKSDFLDAALGEPWRLSTSQTPQTQTTVGFKILKGAHGGLHSPGGGFGPVADDGYGVSYLITEPRLFFHVSSKVSAKTTDSRRFADNIQRALLDICALFNVKTNKKTQ